MRKALLVLLLSVSGNAVAMWFAIGAALLFANSAAAQSAPPLDVKGAALGDSEAQIIKQLGRATFCSNLSKTINDGRRICQWQKQTFAGAEAKFSMFLTNDKLESIMVTVPNSEWPPVSAAVIEKYGPPTIRSTRTQQTAMGATVVGAFWAWRLKGQSIVASELGARIDEATFRFHLESYNPSERSAGEIKDRAKDL